MRGTTMILTGLAFLGAVASARADEVKAPIGAALMLDLTAPRGDSWAGAFNEALREPGLAPRSEAGEVLPDGSVRYGKVTVSVRNPCPPGSFHDEPPPLPGRRVRR